MGLLPDKNKPSIPKQNLEDYNILIFSEPGNGKSSFANAFNDCVLTMFENSTKAMLSNDINLSQEVEKDDRYNHEWKMFKDIITEFMSKNDDYKTMGVDTITRGYEKAMEFMINEKLNGVHPAVLMNDDDHSGYSLLNDELQKTFGKLLNSDKGTILTAHAQYKKIRELKGTKRHKLIPDTGGSFGKWIMGEVDIIIFLDKDEDGNRIFRLEGKKDFDAKQRLPFQVNEIVVETDDPNPGKYMYEKFKKEFDKAIKNLNEELGVTDKMIKEHYQEKKKEQKLSNIQDKIKDEAKNKGLNGVKNAKIMDDIVGVDSIHQLDVDMAKEYLDYLKNEYDG